MSKERFCRVCGKLLTTGEHGSLCWKHYTQYRKYGEFKDSNPRTYNDPNEFRFIGNDIVEMDTYDKFGNVNCTYTIDAEDYPEVSKYKWNTTLFRGVPYAKIGDNKKRNTLHRFVMNPKKGAKIDHINGDTTNNCKSNLRNASTSLNNINLTKNGRLNKGVYQKKSGKWYAIIQWEHKQHHSPMFESKEEACFARYILEQKFVPHKIIQHNTEEIAKLTQEQKDYVLKRMYDKFSYII